ncbi:MAG: hypothetical protein ABIE07_00960 [Candidatus Zixiibacteriota bacterium]
MSDIQTIDKLERQISQLLDDMLAEKSAQIDFLIGLNQLDDIYKECRQGILTEEKLASFLCEKKSWLETIQSLPTQKSRAAKLLSKLYSELAHKEETSYQKLAEELKIWIKSLGQGSFKLTLKKGEERVSLNDRYQLMLRRETLEMDNLIEKHGHILTCLNDIIKSAESKTDTIYQHMAASVIYFLQMEGYKVDPYVKKLKELKTQRLG